MDRWGFMSPPLNLGRLVSMVEMMLCELGMKDQAASFWFTGTVCLVHWDLEP